MRDICTTSGNEAPRVGASIEITGQIAKPTKATEAPRVGASIEIGFGIKASATSLKPLV